MRLLSQRRAFTILMTLFASTFVMAIAGRKFGGQDDVFADIFKTAILVAVSTAAISFTVWTFTHLKRNSLLRGAFAGLVSAALIIPLPAAVWRLKSETFSAYKNSTESFLEAVMVSIAPALASGLYTFADITKASVIALLASMTLGGVIAYYVKPDGSLAEP